MHSILQDLRYGFRQLRKSPSFTLTAILTLALGIGATTTLFSVVDGVLLKPLNYRDSGRLVVVWERVRFLERLFPYVGPNPRHADIWRKQSSTFSDLTLIRQGSAGVSLSTDHPRLVGRLFAQPNLLDILGVQPRQGRNFLPEEILKGHDNVAIISNSLCQILFSECINPIGKTIRVSRTPYQVVGVLAEGFYFPRATELSPISSTAQTPPIELITPLALDSNEYGWNGEYGNYITIGRLKPQTSIVQATQNLNVLTNDILRQIPANQLDGNPQGMLSAYIQPFKEVIVGRASTRLWLLMAAVLGVLFVACVNLANAQLARVISREREAAVRSALGASATQLLRPALAEVGLLTLTGGGLGVALSIFAIHHLADYVQAAIPRTGSITINLPVLALAVLLTFAATLIFGVLPALRFLRIKPQQALQGGNRASGSRRSALLRRTIVGIQVFACTTLLLITGLFAKSLLRLSLEDRGFSTSHVIAADLNLQGESFSTDKARATFTDGVLDKLRALPGVTSASVVSAMLLTGETWIDGITPTDHAIKHEQIANYRWIGPDYFTTIQQQIVEGRPIDAHDRETHNAVISEATAKAVWPGESSINRQFKRNGYIFTVVGVVADARNNSLRTAPTNMVYLPYWDKPPANAFFLIRSQQTTALVISQIRNTIWSYDPDVTIARIHTLDSQINESLAPEQFQTGLLIAFGATALLLALLGIYGTLSYSVELRTLEVGIRIALGATRQSVYSLMLGTIVTPVLAGIILGCVASLIIGKGLSALLYRVSPTDWSVMTPAIGTFVIAAIIATFLPCRRAARVDPINALRKE